MTYSEDALGVLDRPVAPDSDFGYYIGEKGEFSTVKIWVLFPGVLCRNQWRTFGP